MKRIRALDALKEAGNEAFKAGRIADAIAKYTEAIEAAQDDNETLRATLLSNRAAAHMKVRLSGANLLSREDCLIFTCPPFGEFAADQKTNLLPVNSGTPPQAKSYDSAIADCSACLELDSSYFKAYRTRARAHLALEDYESSLRDFKQAYELAPAGSNDEAALKREVREAEATLKKSKMKDHYKVLGIEAHATEVEIKKAYRKMSLVHHPDKGGDEAVFKEVSSLFGPRVFTFPPLVSFTEPMYLSLRARVCVY